MTNPMPLDPPQVRKVVVLLTNAEWKQLRLTAVQEDTTMQGWLTDTVRAALQKL